MSVLMCIRFCVIDGSDAMRTFDFIYVCIKYVIHTYKDFVDIIYYISSFVCQSVYTTSILILNLLVGGLLEVAVFGHLLKKMEFFMLFPS